MPSRVRCVPLRLNQATTVATSAAGEPFRDFVAGDAGRRVAVVSRVVAMGARYDGARERASGGRIAGRFAMTTLSKVVMGAMGRLRPRPATGDASARIPLPAVDPHGGMPLMEALAARRSSREFAPDPLPPAMLSGLLWAAFGVNRPEGGRTAPSALNAQEVDVYVALPHGAYRYDAAAHALDLVAATDVRRVTGYQDFVDEAPLDLVYVADHARMGLVPAAQRQAYASAAAGAIAQNVYLYAAANGLATVIRAWIDRDAIAEALGLTHDQQVLLSQTVGYPKA
jgi:SagB-type dehydrogenase family enzyme